MFVIVRYGDEQRQIVNINCKAAVFLAFIKAKSGCGSDDVVDLADERGQVKNLRVHPGVCAKKYLKDRETLIVLKVHNDNPINVAGKAITGKVVYTSLLLSFVSNKEFNDALNPHREEATANNATPSKPVRARSFTFDRDEFRRARSKSRSSSSKKSTPRKGRKM
ncbi:hypothetical protein BsWGS_10967 [Bradybaena similaris]